MQVQVRNAFARIRAAVDHDTVTGRKQIQLFRHRAGSEKQFSQERAIPWRCFGQSRHNALGNDQDVHRRLRIYVVKSKHLVIFPDDVGGNFAPDDFFENCHDVPLRTCALSG